MGRHMCICLLLMYVIGSINCYSSDFYTRTFSVPLKVFDGNTTYACIAQPIAADQFLVEFEPQVDRNVIKHMSVSVCDEPYTTEEPMWDCLKHPVCKSWRESLYGWTNYAPGLKHPSNAGMHTGNRDRYLVFQMHGPAAGIHGQAAEKTGGLKVTVRASRPQYRVALGIFGNVGKIPPHVKGYHTDSSCVWNITEPAPIFGYALHSHTRGRTASGYIIRDGEWIEIGKGDPRWPLTFFDMTHKNMYLQKGDTVAVRCTYDNPTYHYIEMGHHEEDEMCNFYIHYGMPLDAPAEDRSYICSEDALTYKWENHLQHIPSGTTDISGDTDQRTFAKLHKEFRLGY